MQFMKGYFVELSHELEIYYLCWSFKVIHGVIHFPHLLEVQSGKQMNYTDGVFQIRVKEKFLPMKVGLSLSYQWKLWKT